MLSVWIVWKLQGVKGAYSTLELAKKGADKLINVPDDFQGEFEWEQEDDHNWTLWARFEDHEDDQAYITECVVDA